MDSRGREERLQDGVFSFTLALTHTHTHVLSAASLLQTFNIATKGITVYVFFTGLSRRQ